MADNTSNTASEKAVEGNKAPNWAMDPFREFRELIHKLETTLMLSMRGIGALRGSIAAVRFLAKDGNWDSQKFKEETLEAEATVRLAEDELARGFPILHAQATISLWSALESAVRLFLARWIVNKEDALQIDVASKIRVKLSDYHQLEGEDRAFYILDRIDQEIAAPLKQGVTRFEALFSQFGLSGPVDEKIRRAIWELNHVRNALVHRSGTADRRLVDACPWLGLQVGKPFLVTSPMYRLYNHEALGYMMEIALRVQAHFGTNTNKLREDWEAAHRPLREGLESSEDAR